MVMMTFILIRKTADRRIRSLVIRWPYQGKAMPFKRTNAAINNGYSYSGIRSKPLGAITTSLSSFRRDIHILYLSFDLDILQRYCHSDAAEALEPQRTERLILTYRQA